MEQLAICRQEHDLGTAEFITEEQKWQAVVDRDKAADGVFFFSVVTTGVYCRPSCGARQPNRENVEFYEHRKDAVAAGFRACKRCKPDQTPSWHERSEMITQACRYIEGAETPPTLAQIAAHAGLSPHHFHRVFKEITGVTPKAYATSHRTRNVKNRLRQTGTVTEAIYDAGYNANSRFYEKAGSFLGMTPQQFRAGGRGQTVRYVIRPCSLGLMLLAATDKGVCSIQFDDDQQALEGLLKADFPEAKLAKDHEDFEAWVDTALAMLAGDQNMDRALPLDIQGTAFQQKVWATLQQIPIGTRVSYTEVAAQLQMPNAVRAVASACARNPVAVAIPCHRVVRSDGTMSGYRWGIDRKRELLARESK